jgi:hypothetical protein
VVDGVCSGEIKKRGFLSSVVDYRIMSCCGPVFLFFIMDIRSFSVPDKIQTNESYKQE